MSEKLWSGPTRQVYFAKTYGGPAPLTDICVCCEKPTPEHEPECYLAQLQADVEALRTYAWGQCESCGEYVRPDHRSGEDWGHTRTEAGEDRLGLYPIPVSCGPVKPLIALPEHLKGQADE